MGDAIISVEELSKAFGQHEVLRKIDFNVEPGEIICIVGSSGSGKSTLLRCINKLETQTSGKIRYHGKEIGAVQKEINEYRSKVGMVFQSFNLFPQYSVLENVTLAPKLLAKEQPNFKVDKKEILAQIDENAKAVLASVGLSDKLNSYPCELSGGQKQRVSIARALALKPRILFFDEPTSALDPELTGEILKVIRDLAKEHMTMVIVTHEMSFAESVSDKVIFMADGVVAEEGTPEQVIGNPQNERTKMFLQKLSDN